MTPERWAEIKAACAAQWERGDRSESLVAVYELLRDLEHATKERVAAVAAVRALEAEVAALRREASVLVRSVVEPYPYNQILGEKPSWVAVARSAVAELRAALGESA